jgi:hypothetical protein
MNTIINEAIKEIFSLIPIEYSEGIILYGENGVLDSIMLVQLIANIEEKILLEKNKSVTIVNDKTFSSKNSPFKNESSIILFIEDIIKNE